MEFSELVNDAIGAALVYAKAYPVVAIVVVALVLFLLYRRPFAVFMAVGMGFLLVGVLYVILQTGSSGVSAKERMIGKGNVHEQILGTMPGSPSRQENSPAQNDY